MNKLVYTEVPIIGKIELVDYYDEFVDYYPRCEMETKLWMVQNVKEDWTILDCGANIGYYSILFSMLASKGIIYAFEPTDTIYKLLNNLRHHKVSNVKTYELALSDKTGKIKDKIFKKWGIELENREFNFTTIDDFVYNEKINKLDLIKIDTDSYDFEVLRGAQKTLEKFNPFVVVELNHALVLRNSSNYEAFRWLKEHGYDNGLILDNENVLLKRGCNFSETNCFNICFMKD